MARVRFEDVDLLGALSRIVDLHTQHYKEDFDLDKELISKLAVSDRSEDKQLLWMSRPCGTYTLREREVYLDGSHENKVWRFYQEQTNDPVLAYAISLKEVRDGKIFGNLYPLNYREHVERMKKLTCPIGNVAVAFADGNGRIGRLWHTLLLSKWNPLFAWLPIESIIHDHQAEYYAAINQSNAQGEGTVFIEFMLGIIKEALTEAINEQPVAQSKEEVRWMKIAAFLRTNHIIQNVDVQNLLNVSPATASRILNTLTKEGKLAKVRNGRYWAYKLAD